MGELGALLLILVALSEPTVQVVYPTGELRQVARGGPSVGFGMRWRIGVGERHAVRLRADWLTFNLQGSVAGEDLKQSRSAFGAEFLWQGRGLAPGFYAGGGLDYVDSRRYQEVPLILTVDPSTSITMGTASSDVARRRSLGAGVTAGYGFRVGSGLLVTEAHASWAMGPTGHNEVWLTASVGYKWNPKQ